MPGNKDAFAVLGDLGDGKYIVRMWVGGHSIDEEFAVDPSYLPPELKQRKLKDKIQSRMGDLSKHDKAKLRSMSTEAPQPDTIDQAIEGMN